MHPSKILGLDLGDKQSPYPNDWSPFGDIEVVTRDQLTPDFLKRWFKGLDAVYFAETGYTDQTFPIACNETHSFLHANPEFYPWKQTPTHVVANPTTWRLDQMPEAIHFPFPVDTERLKFSHKTKAERFVHVVGHRAAHDRNGTFLVLHALRFLKAPVEIVIRCREPMNLKRYKPRPPVKLTMILDDVADYADLYDGDVLLMPRRYGGQSLPMNEAMAAGMPVISLDVEPQNSFLPKESLVEAFAVGRFRTQGGRIAIHACHPNLLAQKIERFHYDPDLVAEMSLQARAHAESISWDALGDEFRGLL